MAKQTDVNSIPATGGEAMFRLKEVLKLAGWTVPESSDGTTYNPAGDQITTGAAGAGGMNNDNAWFVVEEPSGAGGRQWCFQCVLAASEQWRIKLSAATGFGIGNPSATQVPQAVDEVVLRGSGTDAAPTGTTLFPTNGTYRVHCIAQDAAVGPVGNECYGFWFFVTGTGTGALSTCIMQLPMAVGTYVPLVGTRTAPTEGEADPAVYLCEFDGNAFDVNGNSGAAWARNTNGNPAPRGWWRYGYDGSPAGDGLGGPEFQRWRNPYFELQTNVGYSALRNVGSGPYNKDHAFVPMFCFSAFDTNGGNRKPGFKGQPQYLRCPGTNRAYPDTINLSTDAYVYANEVLIPFEDGTAPLL